MATVRVRITLSAVLVVGIALAVPPARSAILRFFHIGSATVERVETLVLPVALVLLSRERAHCRSSHRLQFSTLVVDETRAEL